MDSSWFLQIGQSLTQLIPLPANTSLTGTLPCKHNHLIKLFWCLTVVVGLIKLYYIRIFVFLNLCLAEHSIYLLVCAYCTCAALFGLKYSWLIIYYIRIFVKLELFAWLGFGFICSITVRSVSTQFCS